MRLNSTNPKATSITFHETRHQGTKCVMLIYRGFQVELSSSSVTT